MERERTGRFIGKIENEISEKRTVWKIIFKENYVQDNYLIYTIKTKFTEIGGNDKGR